MRPGSAILVLLLLLATVLAACDSETLRAINAKAAADGTYWMPRNGMGGNSGGA